VEFFNWDIDTESWDFMLSLGEISGLFYIVGLIVLGATNGPIWTPIIGALIGVAVYHLMRPYARMHEAELWRAGQTWGIIRLLIAMYVVQLFLAAVLFGFGKAIGYFS